jgi:hypothetical protein
MKLFEDLLELQEVRNTEVNGSYFSTFNFPLFLKLIFYQLVLLYGS